MLVPLSDNDRQSPEDVIGALRLNRKTLAFEGMTATYLDIECIRTDLFDLFDQVLIDIIEAVDSYGGADAAIDVVNRWRSLLASRGRQKLTEPMQRGLIAELYVLDLVHDGAPIDVAAWRGPLGEPQDIRLPACAIEVKSLVPLTRDIEIHGAAQLAEPGKPLILVLIHLVDDNAGETVSDFAERLIRNASDQALAINRLAMVGYNAADAVHYSARFRIERVQFLQVNGRTPRVVPESFSNGALPGGISYLTYGIELQALNLLLKSGESSLRQCIQNIAIDEGGAK